MSKALRQQSRPTTPPGAVTITDRAVIQAAADIGAKRGDTTVAKTIRDLLRERILDLHENGDPLLHPAKV